MLSAKSDLKNEDIDWWFTYKLPKACGPKNKLTSGQEYLYYQANQKVALTLSPYKLGEDLNGALYNTLKQLFNNTSSSVGWIHYNDEYPTSIKSSDYPKIIADDVSKNDKSKPDNHENNGHCKGTLAFDLKTNSAFWLSHSTPRAPGLNLTNAQNFSFPKDECEYAQTFICISLAGVETAQMIADVLQNQHQPQVFGCKLPAAIKRDSKYERLWLLAQGSLPPCYNAKYIQKHGRKKPQDIIFKSKSGKSFRLIAKSGAWFDDFWIDLVTPTLGTDLRVETWRRLTKTIHLPTKDHKQNAADYGPEDEVTKYKEKIYHHEFIDNSGKEVIDEITNINLQKLEDSHGNKLLNFSWHYTKDHSKWAISEPIEMRGKSDINNVNSESSWVCIADINRMTSQEKRGGGAICFNEPELWKSLNNIECINGKIT